MKQNVSLLAFNRGRISPRALSRIDIDRTRLSAEVQTNYVPRTLGSMTLRPGRKYIAQSANSSSSTARYIPFVFALDDQAYIEISDQNMRVYVDDAVVSRAAVSSSINNGTFDSDLTSWTDADEGSTAASTWASGGYLALKGTGAEAAIRRQQVTVNATDENVKHGLRIEIERGPVVIKVGSTEGDDDYFSEVLGTGTHSLAFTPTGSFWIEFASELAYTVRVDSVAVETPGAQDLTAPWLEADLNSLRWDQSADVIYVACNGYAPKQIQRRGETSWSLVNYEPEDGPFRAINTASTSITPSALSGDVTLTATNAIFKESNVGSLFRLESIGQTVERTLSGADQFSDAIRVTGVGNARIFDIDITGTWSGTITVQRSIDEEGDWSDVSGLSYTSNQDTQYNDELDNQIAYYRIGIKSGDYTSGSPTVTLSYGSGSNSGVARVTAFNSGSSVDAVVLEDFGGTDGTSNWYEGSWSERRGYPSAVAIHESRTAWAGKGKIWFSETDGFSIFSLDLEGDSAPINRSIGKGPVDESSWLFSGKRLMLGTATLEASIQSSSFDEPLTPTAFQIKYPTNQGSANVPIVKIDDQGVFVQRGGTALYRLVYNDGTYSYNAGRLTTLVPEIGEPSITRIAAQRQPDTRLHAVRSDGTVGLWVNDSAEDVSCWVDIEGQGEVEDVFTLPQGTSEDAVYYLVKYTINGSTKRYLEKWALESECVGGTLNKQADSFVEYSGTATTTITGLDHLEGESVVAWGDGKDLGTYTVSSGSITLTEAVSEAVVGLTYTAQFKSVKLAYATGDNSPINQRKTIARLGLVMRNTHKNGVQYFRLDRLDDLPAVEDEAVVPDDYVGRLR